MGETAHRDLRRRTSSWTEPTAKHVLYLVRRAAASQHPARRSEHRDVLLSAVTVLSLFIDLCVCVCVFRACCPLLFAVSSPLLLTLYLCFCALHVISAIPSTLLCVTAF